MSIAWPTQQLRDLAEIRISNVDKKTLLGEQPIKLCNYMDVYSNEYITSRIEFMEASATLAESERFGLNSGDVVITKDSETPDDIGIAAVIMEQIERLVCGYHLALIRPIPNEVDSIYLAKQLSSAPVARHFAIHAGGSTRYGLPVSVIESVEIPTPPRQEQSKIAEILSTLDRVIEQTEALIVKQERINTGLIHDLFTYGIDEQGEVRSAKTHNFKDSPLGPIPIHWEVKRCASLCREIVVGIVIRPVQYYKPEGVVILRSANIKENKIDNSNFVFMSKDDNDLLAKSQVFCGDLVTVRTGYPGTTAVIPREFSASNCVDLVISRPDPLKVRSEFLSMWINSHYGKHQIREAQGGLAQQHFNVSEMKTLMVKVPCLREQEKIEMMLLQHLQVKEGTVKSLAKLRSLKTGLMGDLLTGRMRVINLLESEPKPEKVYAGQ